SRVAWTFLDSLTRFRNGPDFPLTPFAPQVAERDCLTSALGPGRTGSTTLNTEMALTGNSVGKSFDLEKCIAFAAFVACTGNEGRSPGLPGSDGCRSERSNRNTPHPRPLSSGRRGEQLSPLAPLGRGAAFRPSPIWGEGSGVR